MTKRLMSRTLFAIAAGTSACAFSASAEATVAVCANTDISPNATACAGFFEGNLLNGSPADITAQTSALASLGFNWDGNFGNVEKISPLNGSLTVDFSTLLQGISYVGFHYGNGQGGPGEATAFYKIDAGTGLDIITLAYNASSDAVLYSTTPGAVPEPATWGLMLVGFCLMGVAIRRRNVRTSVRFA